MRNFKERGLSLATVLGAMLAVFVPVYAFSGGFTSAGTTSFSGLSGKITSAQMVDPEVPVNGTKNITGALTVSGVTTSGGVILPSAIAPAATNAYVDYDGTNLVQNVPTGKGFSWGSNGTGAFSVQSGGSGGSINVTGVSAIKNAAYVATKGDSLVLADPNAAAGSFAITLPAANISKGAMICVKVVATHATRVVTVIRAGSDTIEGVSAGQTTTTFTTTANLASACYQSNGINKWYLTSSNGGVS